VCAISGSGICANVAVFLASDLAADLTGVVMAGAHP
jgi:hypothetical protein